MVEELRLRHRGVPPAETAVDGVAVESFQSRKQGWPIHRSPLHRRRLHSDRMIEVLSRTPTGPPRHRVVHHAAFADRPKAMSINGYAASGGDACGTSSSSRPRPVGRHPTGRPRRLSPATRCWSMAAACSIHLPDLRPEWRVGRRGHGVAPDVEVWDLPRPSRRAAILRSGGGEDPAGGTRDPERGAGDSVAGHERLIVAGWRLEQTDAPREG